jgi:hypothetical protein
MWCTGRCLAGSRRNGDGHDRWTVVGEAWAGAPTPAAVTARVRAAELRLVLDGWEAWPT